MVSSGPVGKLVDFPETKFYHLKNANKISDDPSSQICREQMAYEMDFVNSKTNNCHHYFYSISQNTINYDKNGHSKKYKFVFKYNN